LVSYTLSKKTILKNTSSLDAVFSSGKKLTVSTTSLYYLKRESKKDFRVAFTVGKKTHKLAVNRNKIKRLMREAFRLNIPEFNIGAHDLVFVFFGQDIPSYKEVGNSIKSLLLSLSKALES
jgi:ribonuclease P protein component